jgi:hypothetical protein
MTPATLQLVLILTDKVFSIMKHIEEVKEMEKEEVLQEIEKERLLKDSLVEEVTLP